MAHSDLIDSLISTYRTLNMTVRPIASAQAAAAGAGGKSLLSVLAEMRAHELATSQLLKNMTMSDSRAASGIGEMDVPQPFDDQDVRVLLSEFGTAREAILALIRSMSDEQFEQDRVGPDGTTTIRAVVESLVARDKTTMAELNSFVPATAR